MPDFHPTQISADGRWLLKNDGTPFFWFADTAWELFHRLNRDEAEHYLQTRANQGFSVIQAVVLAELDGLHTPNAQGDLPLRNDDPTQPVEAYFEHVDWIVRRANELGLTVAMLPSWGDKWHLKWGVGPEIFTPENARVFGAWLGARYADAALVWVLGGDRPIDTPDHRAIIEAMAAGLAENSKHLKTFHPPGNEASSQWFHRADWLDFNMWQTGHARNRPNYEKMAHDRALTPTKPTLDGEPNYEELPAEFDVCNGYLDDYDCRKAAYWALLSGAAGHTYGCHAVWQMWELGREPNHHPRASWRESLELPGASQMKFARQLLEPNWGHWAPDHALIIEQLSSEGAPKEGAHLAAARNQKDGRVLVYCPTDAPFEIDFDQLPGDFWSAIWHDPRTGEWTREIEWARGEKRVWTPPGWGPDWILEIAAF